MCTRGQPADNPGQSDLIDWADPLMVWRDRDVQTERDKSRERWRDVRTSSPSAGLTGEVEEAVGEDEEEVEDGDEGEVALLGLTSTSFFSFRSTCLLFVPGEREKGE